MSQTADYSKNPNELNPFVLNHFYCCCPVVLHVCLGCFQCRWMRNTPLSNMDFFYFILFFMYSVNEIVLMWTLSLYFFLSATTSYSGFSLQRDRGFSALLMPSCGEKKRGVLYFDFCLFCLSCHFPSSFPQGCWSASTTTRCELSSWSLGHDSWILFDCRSPIQPSNTPLM